jgi:DNA-binding CsgD family transcriptional regulator/tetratricopeptide (TPR) repeat protein
MALDTQVPSTEAPVLFGRGELIAAIEARLAAGGGVALRGPDGIGRSVLLDAVAAAATARFELVLRLRPAPSERRLPYAGISDLLGQLPPDAVAALAPPHRAALAAVRRGGPVRAGATALTRRRAMPALLAACARHRPVLLVLDDAQWLDAESAELIGFAMRRRPGPLVRVIAAERWPDPAGHRRAFRLCPPPVVDLQVPPLTAEELTELLEAHGLPCRTASRLHTASGGNPFLALALGRAVAPGPAWRPAPLPEPVRDLLRARLRALPEPVAQTLRVAAFATAPTAATLRRAGRADADRELRLAAAAGAVSLDGEAICFTPPALATVLTDDTDAGTRVAIHETLAASAIDDAEVIRHRALRNGRPDGELTRALVSAARSAAGRGAGRTAAQLYLLAAERCPHRLRSHRPEWLVAAATSALAAGEAAVAGQAAEAVLAADGSAAHRVRARLVLLDLAGQALGDMDEMFAAAIIDAGQDRALLAPLRLRLAWRAMVGGDPRDAAAEAARAAADAGQVGDTGTEAMALSALAQAQRVRGDAEWSHTLRRALALPAAAVPGWLHLSPRYLAARLAMVDDRLDEARTELLTLLAVAQQDRSGEAVVEVLRSLSEVATRAGRCRDALRYADRAIAAAQQAGLSPGPTWYTAAVAELAGGSLDRAAGYARSGVRASEEERDSIYLRRNLHALGQASLRAGETRAGVAALRRLRDLETALGATDPLIVRWHGDLAGGLAALGEHAEAVATLAAARSAAHRLGATAGVTGYLDRATAVVLSESGQADSAVTLSAAAAHHFARLHQPIEQGHALLVQGGAERRRRRYAAARVAIGAALAIFLQADAKPWAEQTERALARTERASAPAGAGAAPPEHGLTSTEARIALLVRDGATNREIATRLYLSVKTVEATLTRVYRKLGVRSRTQLSSRLLTIETPAAAVTRAFPDSMTVIDA